ncbi:hypothetical protein CYY_009785 [Polysphondylium violaceum]|uniref:Peptidase C1A papain C-terminal domain-containing protein n=1 Tax=Polysphondylium violaceum TaxID=133409 RepID=A0A8J4UVP8_9MYCE|nr:hypothetical protein CYY_009785 [Polysphondylium violaceum]
MRSTFISLALLSIILFSAAVSALRLEDSIYSDEQIQLINSKQSSWTAGRNERFEGMTVGQVMSMMGTHKVRGTPEEFVSEEVKATIPDTFDSATNWPVCADNIGNILNQGQCGSCWAFAASECLSNRLCIATNGKVNVTLSPQSLVSCDVYGNNGCNGGIPQLAWEYMEFRGLPTDSCFPYTSGADGSEPACQKTCSDNSSYLLYRAKPLTLKTCNSVEAIQANIMAYGPIEGTMEVYSDFMTYKSGVYVPTSTDLLGGHAIKIVGWGTDSASGLKYWKVANSWGYDWGMNGYFWIVRGTDACGIDRDSSAAQAKTA